MARDIFGYKKRVKIDKRSGSKYSESDIRWEKFKMVIWIVMFLLYMYFVIQPQNYDC